jgi:dTDP-4-dehydrorhamnose reductase
MRIAVTGRHGQVALSLLERAAPRGVEVVTCARPEFDLAEPGDARALFAALRPDVVVSAAAYTAVDGAETEPDLARRVNVDGARAVAEAAAALRVPVLHLSTDYVFDGNLNRPYREDDPVAPLGVYGHSKLDGERAVASATPDHVILRTAWVYSPFGKNFVRTMLRLAGQRDVISVVADQHGSPTSALDIADAVISVARNLVDAPERRELRGIFHLTGGGEATWAEFAQAIFSASAGFGGASARVEPIPTSAYPTPARRPFNSRLDNARLNGVHGVSLPPWSHSLPDCVHRILQSDFQGSHSS